MGKKKSCSIHELYIDGMEFEVELPKYSTVITMFFRVEQAAVADLSGKKPQKVVPTMMVDSNPDNEMVKHRFAFLPGNTVVEYKGKWTLIGGYNSPFGPLALYQVEE